MMTEVEALAIIELTGIPHRCSACKYFNYKTTQDMRYGESYWMKCDIGARPIDRFYQIDFPNLTHHCEYWEPKE